MTSAARVEGVGDVPRHLAGRNQHDVEADSALRVVRMASEPELGGSDDAAPSAPGHRFRRVVDALARLDLDEDERVRRATMSISPNGVFQRRAAMR